MAGTFAKGPLVLGHRGVRVIPNDARGELPRENTMAAFARALEEGADGIELDVRLCKTGEPVVVHDPDLARVFGDARNVNDLSRSDLPSEVPLLEDVLDFCASKNACVNVELKYDVPDKRALAWTCAPIVNREGVLVSSFDPRVLGWLAMRAPRVPRAWLVNATQRNIELAIDVFARRVALYAVHLERRLASPARVKTLAARGLRSGAWTITDPSEARACFSIGIDWVITDNPGDIRAGCKLER